MLLLKNQIRIEQLTPVLDPEQWLQFPIFQWDELARYESERSARDIEGSAYDYDDDEVFLLVFEFMFD